MIDKYIDEQYLVTTLLKKSLNNNKIVQAYMFNGENIEYLLKYAKDFAKDLICLNLEAKEKNNIYNKIDQNIYNELKIIEPENNMIKKEQFLSIKEYLSNKPIEGNKIIYIIKNCEKMNSKTANSMLKFIEDASENLIAIFLTDNLDLVMPTIKSRCEVLNFSNVEKNRLSDIMNLDSEEYNEYLNNTLEFVLNIEKYKMNTFFNSKSLIFDKFIDNKSIELFLNLLLYFYYDVFNYKIMKKVRFLNDIIDDIINISSMNSLNVIIKKINLIENLISNNNFNLNQKLLIDRLIIDLCEVEDE